MKTFLVLIIFIAFLFSCGMNNGRELNSRDAAAMANDTVSFVTQIEPILQKNCSPCHFPGGKLYDTLPFDNSTVIIGHEKGVLQRFKKEDELKLIHKFFEQNRS